MISRIKKDYQNARLNKETLKVTLLAVVLGEIQLIESRSGKSMSETELMTLLKKFQNNSKDMIKYGDPNATAELEIIEAYLPTLMTVDEVVAHITKNPAQMMLIREVDRPMSLVGRFMKEFTGKADGGTVKDAILKIGAS